MKVKRIHEGYKGSMAYRVYSTDGICPAIRTPTGGGNTPVISVEDKNRISEHGIRFRKLTPKECFRLMGWSGEYFEKAQLVNSDAQLYKQAGNGVVVPVIRAIAERLEYGNADA